MTHDKMFEEIGCPDQLKKCQAEIKRQKKFIQKHWYALTDETVWVCRQSASKPPIASL